MYTHNIGIISPQIGGVSVQDLHLLLSNTTTSCSHHNLLSAVNLCRLSLPLRRYPTIVHKHYASRRFLSVVYMVHTYN